MVERCGPVAKERPKARFTKLPHMCADGETVLFRSRENPRGFPGAEGSTIAEDVHEQGQFALCDRWYHFVADKVNIFLGTSAILGRDRVRSEKSGNHGPRPLARGGADGLQRLQFRFEIQTVARLGLDSRGSVTGQIPDRKRGG